MNGLRIYLWSMFIFFGGIALGGFIVSEGGYRLSESVGWIVFVFGFAFALVTAYDLGRQPPKETK